MWTLLGVALGLLVAAIIVVAVCWKAATVWTPATVLLGAIGGLVAAAASPGHGFAPWTASCTVGGLVAGLVFSLLLRSERWGRLSVGSGLLVGALAGLIFALASSGSALEWSVIGALVGTLLGVVPAIVILTETWPHHDQPLHQR